MSVTGVVSNGVVVLPTGVSFTEGTKVEVTPREGRDVAKIVPLAALTQKIRQFGSAKGFVTVPKEFDAPIDDFGEDLLVK